MTTRVETPDAAARSAVWRAARAQLDTALEARKKQAKSFRMLGYNGPGTPRDKRTWELQAVID